MRVATLFGLKPELTQLERFRSPGLKFVGAELEHAESALVFGGDGTLHRHLDALSRRKIPVMVVPVGSGNDFAHSLGLDSVEAACAAWHRFLNGEGRVDEIDLGNLTARPSFADSDEAVAPPAQSTYFCAVAGAGLDAEAARRAHAMPGWLRRRGGYIVAVLQALARGHPTNVTVTFAGDNASRQTLSALIWLIAVANCPQYGHGMKIAPTAMLDDGLLDVCLVKACGKMRLLRKFFTVFKGEHVRMPEVSTFHTTWLRLESESPIEVYADGEPGFRTPVEFSIVRGALRVVRP